MNMSMPRIPPPVFMVLAVLVMILLNYYAPIGRWLDYPWRYLGLALIILGFSLGLGSGLFFRKLGTNPKPGAKATLLVTKGPFKYTRNPMYLGLMTLTIGVAILLGTFSPLVLIPVLFIILHTQFVLREEKLMEDWFGESYLSYKRKTPRWLL
ncbi:methyltransferase family protein [Spirosoma gilvum]